MERLETSFGKSCLSHHLWEFFLNSLRVNGLYEIKLRYHWFSCNYNIQSYLRTGNRVDKEIEDGKDSSFSLPIEPKKDFYEFLDSCGSASGHETRETSLHLTCSPNIITRHDREDLEYYFLSLSLSFV